MKHITFETLYHTDFLISEAFAKYQSWYARNSLYTCINHPKPSHTLLWFKNVSGKITDKNGYILNVDKNQLVYTAKGTEYTVEFFDTQPNQTDTIVIHFQMTDIYGEDISPADTPELCLSKVEASTGIAIETLCEEFKKNIVCIPETDSVIYRIIASVCKKRKRAAANYKYACISEGIELLENDSDKSINEIARICGVSECYFRKLFREYSGLSPMDFRQMHRIEKAKQLLSSEMLTIGEVAQELHFADIYHFSKTFKQLTGISPKNYKK